MECFDVSLEEMCMLGGRGYADNENNKETEGEHLAPYRVFKRSLDGYDAVKKLLVMKGRW